MTKLDTVEFFEIWDGVNFIADVGFATMHTPGQAQADALARTISPTAVAHYDRCGEVWA